MDIVESAEIYSGDTQWGEESVEFSAEGTVMSRERGRSRDIKFLERHLGNRVNRYCYVYTILWGRWEVGILIDPSSIYWY